ncbi:MAG: hypothetical protein EOP84_29345 [Verrucomicrobiaceae bacterium]|nr:MAG: hypothetical protein EOP84_29345 [Verrucomicrobiaceae bacterium]
MEALRRLLRRLTRRRDVRASQEIYRQAFEGSMAAYRRHRGPIEQPSDQSGPEPGNVELGKPQSSLSELFEKNPFR